MHEYTLMVFFFQGPCVHFQSFCFGPDLSHCPILFQSFHFGPEFLSLPCSLSVILLWSGVTVPALFSFSHSALVQSYGPCPVLFQSFCFGPELQSLPCSLSVILLLSRVTVTALFSFSHSALVQRSLSWQAPSWSCSKASTARTSWAMPPQVRQCFSPLLVTSLSSPFP